MRLYGTTWENIRRRILERDRACVKCASVESLQVHHIIALRDGGSNEDSNLETLCKQCHLEHHNPHLTPERRERLEAWDDHIRREYLA